MKATRTCSTPDCTRPSKARGMCQNCYGRAYRSGAIHPTLKIGVHSLSEVDLEAETAICAICGPTPIRVRRGGRGHECMTVRKKHRRSSLKRKSRTGGSRRYHLKHKYGLTDDDYAAMWLEQDGECAICAVDGDLVVDHSHGSGEVRGLLCRRCNVALGWMNDQPDRLRAAAAYLELPPAHPGRP